MSQPLSLLHRVILSSSLFWDPIQQHKAQTPPPPPFSYCSSFHERWRCCPVDCARPHELTHLSSWHRGASQIAASFYTTMSPRRPHVKRISIGELAGATFWLVLQRVMWSNSEDQRQQQTQKATSPLLFLLLLFYYVLLRIPLQQRHKQACGDKWEEESGMSIHSKKETSIVRKRNYRKRETKGKKKKATNQANGGIWRVPKSLNLDPRISISPFFQVFPCDMHQFQFPNTTFL